MTNDYSAVTSNLLAYLARLPREMAAKQNLDSETRRFIAEIALDVGNLLLWIQPVVEGSVLHKEQPVGESARTVWALGKQFREVALGMWEPVAMPVDETAERLRRLTESVDSISRVLAGVVERRGAEAVQSAVAEAVDIDSQPEPSERPTGRQRPGKLNPERNKTIPLFPVCS